VAEDAMRVLRATCRHGDAVAVLAVVEVKRCVRRQAMLTRRRLQWFY
jgi:hypothetical protein